MHSFDLLVFIRRRHPSKENQVSGVQNSAGVLHTLLCTARWSRREDVKVAACRSVGCTNHPRTGHGTPRSFRQAGDARGTSRYQVVRKPTGFVLHVHSHQRRPDSEELRWKDPRSTRRQRLAVWPTEKVHRHCHTDTLHATVARWLLRLALGSAVRQSDCQRPSRETRVSRLCLFVVASSCF